MRGSATPPGLADPAEVIPSSQARTGLDHVLRRLVRRRAGLDGPRGDQAIMAGARVSPPASSGSGSATSATVRPTRPAASTSSVTPKP